MQEIFIIFEVSNFDISGNDINELHLSNIQLILVALEISHFEISGNNNNE